MLPNRTHKFQPLRHQHNIWSSSALSKCCPLYPGIPTSNSSSNPSNSKALSPCHSIITNITTQTTYNQHIQNYQQPSISSNSNYDWSLTVIEPHSSSSPSLTPSTNSWELNISDTIMLCLTTNPTDEDTPINPKWKRIILKICHHMKCRIKVQQNKNQQKPITFPTTNQFTNSILQYIRTKCKPIHILEPNLWWYNTANITR